MTNEKKTLKQTIILGLIILLLVTTYTSFSQIVTYINEHQDNHFKLQGIVVLILNYLVYLVGLSRAHSIRNYKRQFMIAAICYSLNYGLYIFGFNNYLGLTTAAVGAIVGGYGASVLWVSQGGYMMKLFKMYKISQDHEGKYIGILNGIVFINNLLGPIIILFGLGLFGTEIYFAILTTVGIFGFLLGFFCLDSLQNTNQEEQLRLVDINSHIEVQDSNWHRFKVDVTQMLKFYPKMKHLFVALLLDGLMQGFISSYFSHLLPSEIRTTVNLGIILSIKGLGSIIGGFLSGILSDKIKVNEVGILGFLFIILTLLMTLLNNFAELSTITYALVIGFMWGVSKYFLEGWIFVCCSKVYNGKTEAFAIAKQLHSFSFIIFLIYMIITNSNIYFTGFVTFLILLTIICILCCRNLKALVQEKESANAFEELDKSSPPKEGI